MKVPFALETIKYVIRSDNQDVFLTQSAISDWYPMAEISMQDGTEKEAETISTRR